MTLSDLLYQKKKKALLKAYEELKKDPGRRALHAKAKKLHAKYMVLHKEFLALNTEAKEHHITFYAGRVFNPNVRDSDLLGDVQSDHPKLQEIEEQFKRLYEELNEAELQQKLEKRLGGVRPETRARIEKLLKELNS